MIKFNVKSVDGNTLFTARIDCSDDTPLSKKFRLAVLWALENDVDLRFANLRFADLRGADLSGALMRGVNLSGVDMRFADLRGADLSGADMRIVDMRGADLSGVNLNGVNLSGAIGDSVHIKTIQTGRETVTYTSEVMQIGSERHTIADWFSFDDEQIAAKITIDGEWWKRWKPVLQDIVTELSPAVPTGAATVGVSDDR